MSGPGRLLSGCFLAVLVITALAWAGDYLVLRIGIARGASMMSTITVKPFYAVPQKSHKLEFLFGDPEDRTCVHSLFPHLGDSPCWYLERHKNPRIDM